MDVGAVLPGGVDPSEDRAVFRQIADQLREAIEKGRLPEGSKLPSEADLMRHYRVARMTVRNAIQLIQAEGLIIAEHGKGVYVRPRPPVRRLASDRFARRHREAGKAAFIAETEEVGGKPTVDSIHVSEAKPPAAVRERLGLDDAEQVVVRSRRYLRDGRPVETATSYIPVDIARGTKIAEANPGPGGIYARIEDLGHRLDRYVEDVTTRMPLPEEVRTLSLPPGVPVFHLVRTAYDETGRAVEVCDTVMASDAFELSYELPAR